MVDSSSCSKISKSESSFDSNQSVAGSAVGDRDVDFQGNESDIEILSNPSQSSIEVLDSHYSSRKHSEERRVFPSLPGTVTDLSLPVYPLVNRETLIFELTGSSNVADNVQLPGTSKINTEAISEGTQTILNPSINKNQDKVAALKNAPLTESSSSGSVTDSICTAYENQTSDDNGDKNNGKKKKKTGKSDDVKASDLTTEPKDDKGGESSDKPKTLPSAKLDVAMIGSMFNQLLQFRNKSSMQETNERQSPIEPYKYSYDDFSSVDHRLKLYLYQHIFDDEAELKWLVRGRIYDENFTDPTLSSFLGLFVISTTKFYVLKAEKEET